MFLNKRVLHIKEVSRENGKETSSQCWNRFWKHFRDEEAATNWSKIWESNFFAYPSVWKPDSRSIWSWMCRLFSFPALQFCCLLDNVPNLSTFVILIYADDRYADNAKKLGLRSIWRWSFYREDVDGKLLLRSHLTFNSWTLPRERKFYNIMTLKRTHNDADVVFFTSITNSACVKLFTIG